MIAKLAAHGARGVDALTVLTAAQAAALKANGVDFAVQYLGAATAASALAVASVGLGFMPVTFADRFDVPSALTELRSLSLPQGVTVWIDLEGIGTDLPPGQLLGRVAGLATALEQNGYQPGLYYGANGSLTSDEIWQLPTVRYWKGMSRLRDRNGVPVEPQCGWCMTQLYPSVTRCGVLVDLDFIGQDFLGRLPTWAIA